MIFLMKKNSIEMIGLSAAIVAAVYAPVLKSNAYVTVALVLLLLTLPHSLNKMKVWFSLFLIPSFLFCLIFADSSVFLSVANIFLLSNVMLCLKQEQIEKGFWLCLSISLSFVFLAILSCIVDSSAIVNFSFSGRILTWKVLGGDVNANVIGLYSVLIVALYVICINFETNNNINRIVLSLICIPIAIIGFILPGSRSAALVLLFFILPLLVRNVKVMVLVLSILLGLYVTFGQDLLALRAFNFSGGDSGRLQYYKDAYNLWSDKGFVPLSDVMLIDNGIILDNLFLGSLFRYGIIFFIGVLIFCLYISYRLITCLNKFYLPVFSLAFSSVVLGAVESSFIGSFFLLLVVLMCMALQERT